MAISQSPPPRRPRVAVTFGDPAGIGPELAAKLLGNPSNLHKADIYLLASQAELSTAIAAAGNIHVPLSATAGPDGAQLLDDGSEGLDQATLSEVSKEGGERCLYQFRRALKMVEEGKIDAIVFAPLNKTSLKMAGMEEEDELRWFAKQLRFKGATSEINIAGELWTGRVTSHVGLEEVAKMITKESVLKAIELVNQLRWESGIANPRLGVCALNPHNGENGNFGRQEIDSIAPAVVEAQSRGINVQGPFPCDTIFLKRSHYDAIVTMYHDQGQIAIKLLSFEGGVTVQGGLPVIIATPAHGTAFDIAGRGIANVTSTQNAFDIAVRMAERRIESMGERSKDKYIASLKENKAMFEKRTDVCNIKMGSCC